MISLYKQNESFIFIDAPLDCAIDISETFSFFAENYFFSPKYKAGIWDGKIKLFNIKTGLFPIGLYDPLIKHLELHKMDYEIDPKLEETGKKFSIKKIKEFSVEKLHLPENIEPRDYQIQGVQFSLYKKKCIILSPTASGKSLIIYILFNIIRYLNKNSKFLLVVPTTSLVEQMYSDFIEYSKNFCDYSTHIQKIYSGQDKTLERTITISTWQSLQNFPIDYFKKFTCVVCDECHTAKAQELTNILHQCINADFKIGLSGTLQKSHIDKLQLQSIFGKIYRVETTKHLMERGLLSNLLITGLILKYPDDIRYKAKKLCWKDEVAYTQTLTDRIKVMMKLCFSDKNTLILFKSVDYGRLLYKLFKNKYPDKIIEYVDGSISVKKREEIRLGCEKNDNTVIIASFGVFSTGVNIKNLHNIIFAESSTSIIRILQSIGRLLRLHKEKKCANLFDICDYLQWKKRENYGMKQFYERTQIYEKEGFNFNIKEIELKSK